MKQIAILKFIDTGNTFIFDNCLAGDTCANYQHRYKGRGVVLLLHLKIM